jgi:hypothetical protein
MSSPAGPVEVGLGEAHVLDAVAAEQLDVLEGLATPSRERRSSAHVRRQSNSRRDAAANMRWNSELADSSRSVFQTTLNGINGIILQLHLEIQAATDALEKRSL